MLSIEHIHPIIVHFPIVFFLTAIVIQLMVMVRGGDLAVVGRQCLSGVGFGALLLAALSALLAAIFGDMALDVAMANGFPANPLELHEGLGLTTTWILLGLAAVQLFCWWRRIPLSGWRGWLLVLVGLVGAGILLGAAYVGGELVHHIGVNVDAVHS